MREPTLLLNRRAVLAGLATVGAAPVALSGAAWGEPHVFMNYTHEELDRNYDQGPWAPNRSKVFARRDAANALAIERLGEPEVFPYGSTEVETVEVYRAEQENAPIQFYIHGGAWRHARPNARGQAYYAPKYVAAGSHFVAVNFNNVMDAGLDGMVDQVRRAIIWVHENAERFGGDRDRLFISGHSSGGHLAGVMVVTDWNGLFGAPPDIIKGATCTSGMYDLQAVRLSARSSYVPFTDEIEQAYSAMRHLDKVGCPVIVAWAEYDTDDFRRQSIEFADALERIGRLQKRILVAGANHFELPLTMANPFAVLGYESLRQMGIDPFEMQMEHMKA